MQVVEKPWGREEIIEVNDAYCVKRLTMNAGCQCSYQYHLEKVETIYVVYGYLYITIEDDSDTKLEKTYSAGDTITIQPGTKHRMRAGATQAIYVECSTPQLEDVVRVEDDYGRS